MGINPENMVHILFKKPCKIEASDFGFCSIFHPPHLLGIYDKDGPYDVFVDVKKIAKLKKSSQSPALEIGSTMVLNDIMELLNTMAQNNKAYKYGQAIVDHIQVVRNITKYY